MVRVMSNMYVLIVRNINRSNSQEDHKVSDFARALGVFAEMKFATVKDYEFCPLCQDKMRWMNAEMLWACNNGHTADRLCFVPMRKLN
jgi:hypothetical protein